MQSSAKSPKPLDLDLSQILSELNNFINVLNADLLILSNLGDINICKSPELDKAISELLLKIHTLGNYYKENNLSNKLDAQLEEIFLKSIELINLYEKNFKRIKDTNTTPIFFSFYSPWTCLIDLYKKSEDKMKWDKILTLQEEECLRIKKIRGGSGVQEITYKNGISNILIRHFERINSVLTISNLEELDAYLSTLEQEFGPLVTALTNIFSNPTDRSYALMIIRNILHTKLIQAFDYSFKKFIVLNDASWVEIAYRYACIVEYFLKNVRNAFISAWVLETSDYDEKTWYSLSSLNKSIAVWSEKINLCREKLSPSSITFFPELPFSQYNVSLTQATEHFARHNKFVSAKEMLTALFNFQNFLYRRKPLDQNLFLTNEVLDYIRGFFIKINCSPSLAYQIYRAQGDFIDFIKTECEYEDGIFALLLDYIKTLEQPNERFTFKIVPCFNSKIIYLRNEKLNNFLDQLDETTKKYLIQLDPKIASLLVFFPSEYIILRLRYILADPEGVYANQKSESAFFFIKEASILLMCLLKEIYLMPEGDNKKAFINRYGQLVKYYFECCNDFFKDNETKDSEEAKELIPFLVKPIDTSDLSKDALEYLDENILLDFCITFKTQMISKLTSYVSLTEESILDAHADLITRYFTYFDFLLHVVSQTQATNPKKTISILSFVLDFLCELEVYLSLMRINYESNKPLIKGIVQRLQQVEIYTLQFKNFLPTGMIYAHQFVEQKHPKCFLLDLCHHIANSQYIHTTTEPGLSALFLNNVLQNYFNNCFEAKGEIILNTEDIKCILQKLNEFNCQLQAMSIHSPYYLPLCEGIVQLTTYLEKHATVEKKRRNKAKNTNASTPSRNAPQLFIPNIWVLMILTYLRKDHSELEAKLIEFKNHVDSIQSKKEQNLYLHFYFIVNAEITLNRFQKSKQQDELKQAEIYLKEAMAYTTKVPVQDPFIALLIPVCIDVGNIYLSQDELVAYQYFMNGLSLLKKQKQYCKNFNIKLTKEDKEKRKNAKTRLEISLYHIKDKKSCITLTFNQLLNNPKFDAEADTLTFDFLPKCNREKFINCLNKFEGFLFQHTDKQIIFKNYTTIHLITIYEILEEYLANNIEYLTDKAISHVPQGLIPTLNTSNNTSNNSSNNASTINQPSPGTARVKRVQMNDNIRGPNSKQSKSKSKSKSQTASSGKKKKPKKSNPTSGCPTTSSTRVHQPSLRSAAPLQDAEKIKAMINEEKRQDAINAATAKHTARKKDERRISSCGPTSCLPGSMPGLFSQLAYPSQMDARDPDKGRKLEASLPNEKPTVSGTLSRKFRKKSVLRRVINGFALIRNIRLNPTVNADDRSHMLLFAINHVLLVILDYVHLTNLFPTAFPPLFLKKEIQTLRNIFIHNGVDILEKNHELITQFADAILLCESHVTKQASCYSFAKESNENKNTVELYQTLIHSYSKRKVKNINDIETLKEYIKLCEAILALPEETKNELTPISSRFITLIFSLYEFCTRHFSAELRILFEDSEIMRLSMAHPSKGFLRDNEDENFYDEQGNLNYLKLMSLRKRIPILMQLAQVRKQELEEKALTSTAVTISLSGTPGTLFQDNSSGPSTVFQSDASNRPS